MQKPVFSVDERYTETHTHTLKHNDSYIQNKSSKQNNDW